MSRMEYMAFRDLVRRMRAAQEAYFETRRTAGAFSKEQRVQRLQESKQLERQVDRELEPRLDL